MACTVCRTSKRAAAEAMTNMLNTKPKHLRLNEAPQILVVTSGNGTTVDRPAAGGPPRAAKIKVDPTDDPPPRVLSSVFDFVSVCVDKLGAPRDRFGISPVIWCTDLTVSKPTADKCRRLVFDQLDKKNLKGIILYGRKTLQYFLARGSAPPQPEMIWGRMVRVYDVNYPIFLMPELESLAEFDPTSQSLRNEKGHVSKRLTDFLALTGMIKRKP